MSDRYDQAEGDVDCEFCGGRAEQLARTRQHVWLGCRDCHRSWKEQSNAATGESRLPLQPGAHDVRRRPLGRPSTLGGTAIAVLAVALAFGVRIAIKPLIGGASPFMLFTLAIMVGAFYGGTIPGVVATILSAFLGNHFFLRAFGESRIEQWDRVALFLLVGGLIIALSAVLSSSRRRLAASLWREQTARAQAEAANQTKDEFLALVSHELQTPASVVLGWASMVRARQLTGAALDHALDAIERNAKLQSRLVADVLDASRIASGTLRFQPKVVSLATVVSTAIEQLRPSIDVRGLTLDVDITAEECPVLADPVRLQQVFTNILSNAVKFTPGGGRIVVHMARAGDRAVVAITDTGVGIAAEFLPRVFRRFEQDPHTLAYSRQGLGLGLSIARHFVERQGGTIRADSQGPGLGSTFTIEFPLARDLESADRHGSPGLLPLDALRALSVMVVEDDADTRAMLARMLERYGATVVAAGSAAEALRLVEERAPDVLLCDLRMPDQDGFDLLRTLRAESHRGRSIPAASITASRLPQDRDRALAAGFQLHLEKPVDPADLASALLLLVQPHDGGSRLTH